MKKSLLFCATAFAAALSLVAVTFATAAWHPELVAESANDPYKVSLSTYADYHDGVVTKLNNRLNFTGNNVTDSSGKIRIAKGGHLRTATKIAGIERVDITLASGSVTLEYSAAVGGDPIGSSSALSTDLRGIYPNAIKIVANEDTVIEKIDIQYACYDYQAASQETGITFYVNDVPQVAAIVDTKSSTVDYDQQFKITLDVYSGDILSFVKDNKGLYPTANNGGNCYKESSRGYLCVKDTAMGVDLYLKRKGTSYDVYLFGEGGQHPLHSSLSEGPILQAFNWSASAVKAKLADIKAAGYASVQMSPMQVRKWSSGTWRSKWWSLYQPFGMKIAEYADQGVLGTDDDLADLCAEAKKQGIGIVMDVVLNHLGGNDNPEGTGWQKFDSEVQYVEGTIYSNDLRHDKLYSDNPIEATVRCPLSKGYPDLKTEDSRVMERCLQLLKDYLDCGVTGFRFDAAKHVETPFDGDFASSFWPYVVNGARRYAKEKGYDTPFCYGEALGAGDDRSFDWYAPYMAVTDGANSYDLRDGVNWGKPEKINDHYYTGLDAGHNVLWAESHDLYQEGTTSGMSTECVNKVYAIQASRDYAIPMYLSRPSSDSLAMGASSTIGWSDRAVKAINTLHNRYYGQGEKPYVEDGSFVNVRGNGAEAGAVVVNINRSAPYTVHLDGLWNGTYRDLVSGADVTVTDGYATVNPYDGVSVLVPSVTSDFYLVGNSTYTGKSESQSWNIASGKKMTKGGTNLAQIENQRFEAGAAVKVIRAYSDDRDWDWYDVELPESYSYCSTDKDSNLVFSVGGTYSIYLNYEGKYYVTGTPDSTPEPEPDPEPTELNTFYFTNGIGWSDVYVYCWNSGGEKAAWPGEKATKVGKNEYNQDIYSFTGIAGYEYLIVNNGSGTQSSNIKISDFGTNNAIWMNGTGTGQWGFWTR